MGSDLVGLRSAAGRLGKPLVAVDEAWIILFALQIQNRCFQA
jgi:hypothetical protein